MIYLIKVVFIIIIFILFYIPLGIFLVLLSLLFWDNSFMDIYEDIWQLIIDNIYK